MLLLKIIVIMMLNPALMLENGIDAAELFAGCMSVTLGIQAQKLLCVPFEIEMLGDSMDLCSPAGFCLALSLVLRMGLQGHGLLWLAPVCATWIFMSRGSTGRCKILPDGWTHHYCVRRANIMNSRCILLCMLAHHMGLAFILEQPASSVFNLTTRFQEMVSEFLVWVAKGVHMGAYGGESQKELKLWSNRQWVEELIKEVPRGTVFANNDITKVYYNKHGQKKVTGGKGLKATQYYPKDFGIEVGEVFKRHIQSTKTGTHQQLSVDMAMQLVAASDGNQDPWDDAQLQEVLTYLHEL